MYNTSFIFDECGFSDLPEEIKRERLFNVSFDLDTGDIKLYVLDRCERFLYKISRDGVTRQYSGDDPEHGGDPDRLNRFLGVLLNPYEIVIDAVEGETYYVYLDDASIPQSLAFFSALRRVYDVTEDDLLCAVNGLGRWSYHSLRNVVTDKAVSLVKLPFDGQGVKIYTRPFLLGAGYSFTTETTRFLCRLYRCELQELTERLKYAWVAGELKSNRKLIVTQYHALLHDEE
jgi:hypothetical protein